MIKAHIRNLHITIILISVILNPHTFPYPSPVNPTPSLTLLLTPFNHHHPTTLNLAR